MPRRIGSKGMAHGRKYCIAAARAVPRDGRAASRVASVPFRGRASGAHGSRGTWVVAPRSIITNKPLTDVSSLDTSETGLPL